MENKLDKTFNFYIPSDDGDVLVTGQMWADNLDNTIVGWPHHAAVYFNFSSEKYPDHPTFVPGETLTFLIGPDEDLRIGRHTKDGFEEIFDINSDFPTFVSHLKGSLLTIALVNPPKGHFDETEGIIYPG